MLSVGMLMRSCIYTKSTCMKITRMSQPDCKTSSRFSGAPQPGPPSQPTPLIGPFLLQWCQGVRFFCSWHIKSSNCATLTRQATLTRALWWWEEWIWRAAAAATGWNAVVANPFWNSSPTPAACWLSPILLRLCFKTKRGITQLKTWAQILTNPPALT